MAIYVDTCWPECNADESDSRDHPCHPDQLIDYLMIHIPREQNRKRAEAEGECLPLLSLDDISLRTIAMLWKPPYKRPLRQV